MQVVVELALHFNTFTNIDLYRQGLYFVRGSFITLNAENERTSVAMPYHLLDLDEGSKESMLSYVISGPSINDDDQDNQNTFSSNTFKIMHREQQIHLNNCATFRLILPDISQRVVLQMELLFTEYGCP